mgnify:CR=1 FL=1
MLKIKNMYKQLKQGQKVQFKIDDVSVTGKVVGVATVAQPILGSLYIIEPDTDISNEVYQYTHCVQYRYMLTLID